MNIDELSKILSNDISNAPYKRKLITFILFGIRYADYLGEGSVQVEEILTQAGRDNDGINISHDAQINHGRILAKYVTLK